MEHVNVSLLNMTLAEFFVNEKIVKVFIFLILRVSCFYHEWMLNFSNAFSTLWWLYGYSFILLMWWNAFFVLLILNQHCITRINATRLLWIIKFIYFWIQFISIFKDNVSMPMRNIGLKYFFIIFLQILPLGLLWFHKTNIFFSNLKKFA